MRKYPSKIFTSFGIEIHFEASSVWILVVVVGGHVCDRILHNNELSVYNAMTAPLAGHTKCI